MSTQELLSLQRDIHSQNLAIETANAVLNSLEETRDQVCSTPKHTQIRTHSACPVFGMSTV